MISPKYLIFCLVFLGACTTGVQDTGNPFLDDPAFCNVDADCTCGGTFDGQCFVGNMLFSSVYVDTSQDCPDFCSGVDGNLETKCVDNTCQLVGEERIACPEDAKVCPDGTVLVREGPECEFPPCPGAECSSDSDCVPATCCHATECVPKDQAPDCDDVMCTMECRPGTLDCGGSCACVEGECTAQVQ